MKPIITIVVPVYNVEKYLSECLDSLLAQTYENLEILLINDGSTDDSEAIAKRYEQENPEKVHVHTKENAGPGPARNDGIQMAKGEYILFADSDDICEPNMVADLYEAIKKTDSQIAFCPYIRHGLHNEISVEAMFTLEAGKVYTGEDFLQQSDYQITTCSKLYQTAFIRQFQFPAIWYEDVAWLPVVMSYATKITYLPKTYYHYLRHEDSIVSSVSDQQVLGSLDAILFIKEHANPERKQQIAPFLANLIFFMCVRRAAFADRYIALLVQEKEYFLNNCDWEKEKELKTQINKYYEDYVPIPKVIYYDHFGKEELTPKEQQQIENWVGTLVEFDTKVICLNEENCDVHEDPAVEKAYEEKRYEIVGQYFKCKMLWEKGGIALSKQVKGEKYIVPLLLRSRAFFGFKGNGINEDIFAAAAGQRVIQDILSAFASHIEESEPLQEAFREVLLDKQHLEYSSALEQNFKRRYLTAYEEQVRIYATSVLTYNYGTGTTFASVEPTRTEISDTAYTSVDAVFLQNMQQVTPEYFTYHADQVRLKEYKKRYALQKRVLQLEERVARQNDRIRRLKETKEEFERVKRCKILWYPYLLFQKIFKRKKMSIWFGFLFAFLMTNMVSAEVTGGTTNGATIPQYEEVKTITVDEEYIAEYGEGNTATAINYALREAKTEASSKLQYKVVVPEGYYLMDNTLVIYSNTYLYCEGATFIKIKDAKASTSIRTSMEKNDGGYDQSSNIIVQGGTWDSSNYQSQYKDNFSVIKISHTNNLLLKNMVVKYTRNGHHLEMAAVKNATIEGCTFRDWVKDANNTNKEAIQLDLSNQRIFGGCPADDNLPCRDILIQNNLFWNVSRGIGSHSGMTGVYFENIRIINNTFESLDGHAVYAFNWKNVTIDKNRMKHSSGGIFFNYLPSDSIIWNVVTPLFNHKNNANLLIQNNVIGTCDNANTTIPIWVQGGRYDGNKFAKGNYDVANVLIRENTLNDSVGGGIVLRGTRNAQIYHNTIKSIKGTHGSNTRGVLLRECYATNVHHNRLEKIVGDGIVVTDNSSSVIVHTNQILSNTGNGVEVKGNAQASIFYNVITGNGKSGVALNGNSKNVYVTKNIITKNKAHGITGTIARGKIQKNTIIENKGSGISLAKAEKLLIKENRIQRNKKNGLDLSNTSGKSNVSNNVITGNKKNGVLARDTKASCIFRNNKVYKNSRKELLVTGTGTVRWNDFKRGNYVENYSVLPKTVRKISFQIEEKEVKQKGKDEDKESQSTDKQSSSKKKSKTTKKELRVTLSWKRAKYTGAYKLYRSEERKGTYQQIAYLDGKTKKYIDKNVKRGKTYYYKIIGFNTKGEGKYSKIFKCKIKKKEKKKTETKSEKNNRAGG